MNRLQTISYRQMSILFFIFMTGSSSINIPGPLISKSDNAAWLSILIAGGLGLCMLACMLFLQRQYPDMTYVEYSQTLIGTWPTVILSIGALAFIWHTESGIILDISLFMVSSMQRESPLYIYSLLISIVSALAVRAGLEVMTRMFILIMIPVAFSIAWVLLMAIPTYSPESLLPIMPNGIKPILNGAYTAFGFPYAEVFLFAMLLKFTNQGQGSKLTRAMILSLLINIIVLCATTVCTIMAYGPLAGTTKYTLYMIARNIEFQEIITRIESIIGFALISASFMKASITLYVFSLFVTQLLKLNDYRLVVTPLALLGFLLTLVGYDSITQWGNISVGMIQPLWVWVSLAFPMLLLTLVAYFKKGNLQG
ncbi:GerAB/ArcD/ProY family transporter [Paenibacillus montanisoli]|uniref:Spore gernimation protein n=1 Tax=Paenibacillus montanisoli TaxID=2081970 RepID=A0A328U389_9BACL|nr:GerAB/ArcD/ProY family transporter [Paenibacillus montanisoli]RAP77287.1 spore gernimation protein [Paenibacillus montanisoli]